MWFGHIDDTGLIKHTMMEMELDYIHERHSRIVLTVMIFDIGVNFRGARGHVPPQ